MKRKIRRPMIYLGLFLLTLTGSNGFGQSIQPKTIQPTISVPTIFQKPRLQLNTFNKSLSPKYLDSTKKYLKVGPKTSLSTNAGAAAVSTVKLNKGGSEGITLGTTETQPTQDGAFTCLTRNVNTTSDFFRQPMFELHNIVYPGALYDATDIINNSFRNFPLPTTYRRQPYRLSANLFTMSGGPSVDPTEVIGDQAGEDYSLASYRAALGRILNRSAAANPPVEAFIEYLEASTREEVATKLGYNFKANIPAELAALLTGIPVGVNANVSASVIANAIKEKSRLILKVNYNFYSVNASPTNDNSLNLMTPPPGNDLSNNLVYVSSVLYGTTGYVYFESEKSLAELQTALEETVGVAGPLNQGSASVSISAEAKAKFNSTVTKMVAFGRGLGITPGTSLSVTSLDNLLSLIGTLKNWGPNNQGSPIAYTMNFVKDDYQAVVSYGTQFPNKVCTQTPLSNLKYDVDLELNHFVVSNVRDLDGTEDLYGQIDFTNLKALTKTASANINFFKKSEADANQNNFRPGTRQIDKKFNLIKNITFDELRNIELTVGGQLYDDEGPLGSRIFRCTECSDFSVDYGKRTIKFIELVTTQTSINSLVNNGNFQDLRFAGDKFFELNFYESNKKDDGWVRVMWKVWVKPHP